MHPQAIQKNVQNNPFSALGGVFLFIRNPQGTSK